MAVAVAQTKTLATKPGCPRKGQIMEPGKIRVKERWKKKNMETERPRKETLEREAKI